MKALGGILMSGGAVALISTLSPFAFFVGSLLVAGGMIGSGVVLSVQQFQNWT